MSDNSVSTTVKQTPMIRQYLEIKKAHQNFILFFRLGDFYEMFFEDAKEASAILNITLTARGRTEGEEVPMCGIPYHSAESYIQKLLDAGKKIAICEQMGDPALAKGFAGGGIVERKVVRVLTPALRPHDVGNNIQNYLASVFIESGEGVHYGLSYVEISTGECRAVVLSDIQSFLNECWRISPKELLWPATLKQHSTVEILKRMLPQMLIHFVEEKKFREIPTSFSHLFLGMLAAPLKQTCLQQACCGLFSYLVETHYDAASHIRVIQLYHTHRTMNLDPMTIRNLELLETQYDRKEYGSLFWVLNQTKTAMGQRLLKRWILYPLLNLEEILERQNYIERLVQKPTVREALQQYLKRVLDIERIVSRLTLGLAHARDVVGLRRALSVIPDVNRSLQEIQTKMWPEFHDLVLYLEKNLVDDPPLTLREGGLIREGVYAELDELILLSRDGKMMMAKMEQEEKEKTGIASLKVRYNQVFGYYIEITKVHLKSVPSHYIRKQTLANAERYMTEDLKNLESKILSAEERRKNIEFKIFETIRERILSHVTEILNFAKYCAELDVCASLAQVASENNYVRPEMKELFSANIIEGRHPVIEKICVERFVPNTVTFDNEKRIYIITGPNMAGKSTVMRQVALIYLLAQMGSFVPAESAMLGVIDRIFTRVGAHDHLAQGESTFMVEMKEAAHILKYATSKSLILLDEIGRGTSTFDGLSIAWSIIHFIHDHIQAKTLFSTHYHELTTLAEQKPMMQNLHVAVQEVSGGIVFLRRLRTGGVARSYGIEVARLAGLPEVVVGQAKEVLKTLEKQHS